MGAFWAILVQSFRLASTLSLGYFINDLTDFLGNTWNKATGMSYKDSNGKTPWFLIMITFLIGCVAIAYIFSFLFPKYKTKK
jgi:hypothetical protein